MSRRFHQCVTGLLTALAMSSWAPRVWALYEPEKLQNPTRRWAVSVGFLSEYDDNIDTSSTNQQGSIRSHVSTVLQANIPREQTFFRMRYQYDAAYTPDRPSVKVITMGVVTNRVAQDKLDQTHVFDALLSHTFSPRLVLDLNDSLRRAVEPALVGAETTAQPTELHRRGDYTANNANLNLSYNLSRRWRMTLQGGWDLWRYDTSVITNITVGTKTVPTEIGPAINDRDSYRATLETLYGLSPRIFTGVGYQFSVDDYVNPGSNDVRNSISHIGYFAFNESFSPKLSSSMNVGLQLREFSGGTQDTSPFASASLNYNFARQSTASLGFRYSIFSTEVSGFRSTDTAQLYGQARYRFTQKFSASARGVLSMSTFQNPTSTDAVTITLPSGKVTIPKEEDTYSTGLSLDYDFTPWASSFVHYDYDRAISDVPGRTFSRNRVGLGLSLHY